MPAAGFTASLIELPAERAGVAAFVDSVYVAAYAASPPRADAYAAIRHAGELVCCMGLEWAGADGRLPIERVYCIERDEMRPMTRFVQLGRWASKDARAGVLAVYAAVVFGLARGSDMGLVEHDDRVHQYCERLGMLFQELPSEGIDLTWVQEANRAHYALGTMRPYLVDLRQVRDALAARARGLVFAS